MGEATTKAAILREFIELLNWEIPKNTELEYSVKAFGKTYKVDYALLLEGRPVAFLEAKGLDTSLTDNHRDQLSEYLRKCLAGTYPEETAGLCPSVPSCIHEHR